MPLNKLALLRYRIIDQCLCNRNRKWTLGDLVKACSTELFKTEGISSGVSLRTLQLDIQHMRGAQLGYNAPIVVEQKKYYTYADPEYSITKSPLSKQDFGHLVEAVEVLNQFKHFGFFEDMLGTLTRLEEKLNEQKDKRKSFIEFEHNELTRGLEHISELHSHIRKRHVLELTYQSFKSKQAQNYIISPYLLKEYRNRWFLICSTKGGKQLLTLALDRIVNYRHSRKEKYFESRINWNTWFEDTIGVSKTINHKPINITIEVNAQNAPYLLTKPLHHSQILKHTRDNGSAIFSLKVVWNFELERELLGFGENLKVLGPVRLKRKIYGRLTKNIKAYEGPID